jgi:CIC family chloride channel protein
MTSIILAVEMTMNYTLILPLLATCLVATMVAHGLGGQPIYSVLLRRTLERTKREQAARPGLPEAGKL